MNSVQILGRLTKDPEVRYTQDGKAVSEFSIAFNRSKEDADFYDCTAWEKTAENIANYFKKGQRILIDGRLQQDKWRDQQSGETRSKIKIIVNRFDFIEPAGENQQGQPAPRQQSAPPTPPPGYGRPPAYPQQQYGHGQYPPAQGPQQQQMFAPPPPPARGGYYAPPQSGTQMQYQGNAYPPPGPPAPQAQPPKQSPYLYDQQGAPFAREANPDNIPF